MPKDFDKIDVSNSDFYRGTPTFAMKRGEKVPYLMYQLGVNEKSLEEIRDIFGSYLDDESLGQGYVYNASGLTYGDMNSLMNSAGSWLEDWDGFYSFYEYNNNVSRISPEVIFNIFENKPFGRSPQLYEQTYVNGSWGVGLSQRQELLGSDQTIANPQGYGMRHVIRADSLEKEASVGMIVRDGDPSSPPSDIFMAAGHTLKRVDRILDTLQDLRYLLDELVEVPESSSGQIFDSISEEDNFYNRTARTQQLLSEAMNQMSMLATEEFNAEDPTQAKASNMGGPTTPGNAGVPADVGGDDLVPYDSPSSPPAGVFEADYKTYESRPVRNALFGVAFAVSGLYFWSTAGSVVKNWVVVRVEKYAPKLLEPQFQTMLTLTAFFGIIYFGMKLRGSSKGLTIPSMIDLPLVDA